MTPHATHEVAPALDRVIVREYGDSALLVTARRATDDEDWRVAHHVEKEFTRSMPHGVLGTIATYDAVLVEFDCTVTDHAAVVRAVGEALATLDSQQDVAPRTFVVPVVYGGDYGPDLADLAQALGITEDEIVRLHSEKPHLVRAVLSPAGAPMSDVTLPAQVGRRASPRVSVPAGTVAVAGRQATVYATSSPGGWQLIGRTPLTLFDIAADPPVRYRAGDLLRFVPIPAEDFPRLVGHGIEQADD